MRSAEITRLAATLPPDLGADEEIDWHAVEDRWGTRLPSDYVEFMSVYGAGGTEDLVVLIPLPKPGLQWDHGAFEDETGNAQYTWDMRGGQQGLDIDPEDILAWGITTGADILCWLTTDPDPDKWPVLICGRHTRRAFTLFPMGMVEFLRRVLDDEITPYPLSIDIRGTSRQWIHWLEEQRQWLASHDPETEPSTAP